VDALRPDPAAGPCEVVVETADLTRRYGNLTAVDCLTISVPAGIVYGFLGPNGAGKSTTIKMLTALLAPTSGAARVCGHDVRSEPLAVKAALGVVPEELPLYERLTGREQLELAGRLRGLSVAEIERRGPGLLDILGLAGDADKMVVDYSHGMRKKIALACALIHGPRVLFLDEPFSGIDPLSTSAIKRLLRSMVETRGTTVFFSTHVMELAQAFCDRVAIIHKGVKVAEGTLPEVREEAGLGPDATLEDVFVRLVGGGAADEEEILAWLAPSTDAMPQ
jgi:ABC-2 type transport system ATP-binding protein